MILRVLPPAHSVLTLSAVFAGVGALRADSCAIDVLRSRLLERSGAADVELTDTGTSALQLAIAHAVVKFPGRPVALPAWACYDVLTAAIGAGAPLLFYDLDPDTLAPDVATLTRLASLTPAAVILVHAFGVPVNLASARRTLPPQTVLIEDSAQAHGATRCRQT